MKNLKPKSPCSTCKGDHFLMDCPGIPKVLEVWSSMSSTPTRHVGDTLSTSDIQVGKKKTTVKFPCMLCKGDHYSHLCPRMDEASSLLKKIQLPKGYHKLSTNPLLVDRMVNLVPSSVSPVDQVVNLVSSSVEPLTKVADLFPSSISPNFPFKSETQVNDLFPSSVSATLHLKSVIVVDPTPPLINPTPPLRSFKVTSLVPSLVSPILHPKSAKLVALVTSSVNPTLPLKSANVVNLIPSSIDPTLPLESKPDYAHVFLVHTGSTVLGGIPLSPAKTPPSNEDIIFYWGVLTGPCLPSHIPFKILIKVCGRDIPHMLIDEGFSALVICLLLLGKLWVILSFYQLPILCSILTEEPLTL
jgi:hypothetical protein